MIKSVVVEYFRENHASTVLLSIVLGRIMMINSEGTDLLTFAEFIFEPKVDFKCLTFFVQFAGHDPQWCLVITQITNNNLDTALELTRMCPTEWQFTASQTAAMDNSPANSWATEAEGECKLYVLTIRPL